MSNLPQWLESARETVDAAVQSRAAADKNESAMTAKELLDSQSGPLAAVATAVGLGRDRGWLTLGQSQNAVSVRSSLEAVVSKGSLRRDVNHLQTKLPSYVAQLIAEVERQWKQHVELKVGRIEDLDALIRLMAALPGQESQRTLLEELRKPLLDLAKAMPSGSSETDLEETAKLFEKVFSKAFGNEEIRQFLLACSRTGATLDQMTSNVSDWLNQTGADSILRIRLGQAGA